MVTERCACIQSATIPSCFNIDAHYRSTFLDASCRKGFCLLVDITVQTNVAVLDNR
jgi:hypothetical protein